MHPKQVHAIWAAYRPAAAEVTEGLKVMGDEEDFGALGKGLRSRRRAGGGQQPADDFVDTMIVEMVGLCRLLGGGRDRRAPL